MVPRSIKTVAVVFPLVIAAAAGLAQAQAPAPTAAAPAVRSTGSPQRDTLTRLMRPVSIEFKETRLEDVMRFITDVTQADIDVLWQDDKNPTGLDKDAAISVNFAHGSVMDLLEKVMEKSSEGDGAGTGNTWQMIEAGTLQVGPKVRLNKWRRLQIYSIADLLTEVPNYTQAPEFDLQSVLQNGGQGGGGGQSPFRDNQGANQTPRKSTDEKTKELVDLIQGLVEPEQWLDNGGEAATCRSFQGNLLINAPDYVHRQIDGYPWWPAEATHVAQAGGRRYVTLGVDTSNAKLAGFGQVPVTAITGDGTLVRSNPGPGGSTAPATKPTAQPPAEAPKK